MDYFRNFDYLLWDEDPVSIKGTQYRVVTDLVTEPVTVNFFKEHARIDFDTDENLVAAYLKAARIELERWTQLSFGVKTIGLRARELPDNYKLMFGPVNAVTTPATGYTLFGDLLSPGGANVEIEYSTIGIKDEVVQISICAAGLYIFRENIIESKYIASAEMDEAKRMLESYKNISWP